MNQVSNYKIKPAIKVLMFGPKLCATSGISNVVNNWLEVGFASKVNLDYVSTLDDYVPGQYLTKFYNAIRSYILLAFKTISPVDLIHIHVSSGMSFYRKLAILLYAKFRNIKVIVHLHGSMFEEFYNKGSSIQKIMITYMFDKSDAIFVLSKAWEDFIKSICRNNSIYIVYNGASTEKFAGKIDNGDKIIITFMGRLGERKGTYDLLAAFKKLSDQEPRAYLLLGGDGDVDRVKTIVKEDNLSGKICVLGWVSGEEKIKIFRKTDIYALPSYNEGLPGSILEAMAVGVPVVSTPVGGIPEAVLEGKNGFLIDPGDVEGLFERLHQLCVDPALRSNMGIESKKIIEQKFNLDTIVNGLVKNYQEIITCN